MTEPRLDHTRVDQVGGRGGLEPDEALAADRRVRVPSPRSAGYDQTSHAPLVGPAPAWITFLPPWPPSSVIGMVGDTLGSTWMSVLALPPKTMICNSEFAAGCVRSGTPLTVTAMFWPPERVATCEILMLSVP